MQRDEAAEDSRVGLCARCANARIVTTKRGSHFYLCQLADVDPAFPRYPPLPVISCSGFAPHELVAPPTRG